MIEESKLKVIHNRLPDAYGLRQKQVWGFWIINQQTFSGDWALIIPQPEVDDIGWLEEMGIVRMIQYRVLQSIYHLCVDLMMNVHNEEVRLCYNKHMCMWSVTIGWSNYEFLIDSTVKAVDKFQKEGHFLFPHAVVPKIK